MHLAGCAVQQQPRSKRKGSAAAGLPVPRLGTAAALKSDAFLETHKRVSDRKVIVVSIQTEGLRFNSKEVGECMFAGKDKALL